MEIFSDPYGENSRPDRVFILPTEIISYEYPRTSIRPHIETAQVHVDHIAVAAVPVVRLHERLVSITCRVGDRRSMIDD